MHGPMATDLFERVYVIEVLLGFGGHSIDSISLDTPGFILYAPSLPASIPDLALLTLSLRQQAPDYNYNGPVTIQIQTLMRC